jgi:hypothetical protein
MSVTTPSSSIPTAMSSSQAAAALTSASGTSTAGCSCPACSGLASLVRPRFFSGQVLTEVDLTALETYAVDAHRMHNRYLHGWGVVCGLDIACEDCGDGIVVGPGYALDPCGRDLVVPRAQQIDVASMISACLAAERTGALSCDPPLRGGPGGCDTDQQWCLRVRYREVPTRPITPLAGSSTSSTGATDCACGGSGSGWSCTCGQTGSRSTQTCGCTQYVTATQLPPGCEPTRIVECFDFDVCRCDDACCSLDSTLAGTLPMELLSCLQSIKVTLGKRLNAGQQRAMMTAALGSVSNAEQTRQGVGQLYDGVLGLYQTGRRSSGCQLPSEFQTIDWSPQLQDETDALYTSRLVNGTQTLVGLVVAHLRDCLCQHLNPPCPDACDDRVTLGCFTFSDGKVTKICNLECRRYAGSFVSRRYWLPIGPMALWALGELCCFPLVGRLPTGRGTVVKQALDAADPTGNLRRVVLGDNFAVVKAWPAQARAALAKVKPAALRDRFTPSAQAVNLAGYQGQLAGDATESLEQEKVSVQTVDVENPEDVPVSRIGAIGVVEPGAAIRQYVYKGRVIGFGPAEAQATESAPRRRRTKGS